jgi:hypothetical protein
MDVPGLLRLIETDLATKAIQQGIGASNWERICTPALLDAMRKVRGISSYQAKEILEVLGENGQKRLSTASLMALQSIV